MRNLNKLLGKLAHYHYNKNKYFIMGEEKELYNFMIEQSYNPYTVYRWALLERLPDDIRFMIRQKTISQKNAISEGVKRRHETASSLGESIMNKGLRLIERMWKKWEETSEDQTTTDQYQTC